MIKELLRLANHLDAKGLRKEADYLDDIINKVAANPPGLLSGFTQMLPELMPEYFKVMQSGQFHGLYAAKPNNDDNHYFLNIHNKEGGWFNPCSDNESLGCDELHWAKNNEQGNSLAKLDEKPEDVPDFEMPAQEEHSDSIPQAKEEPQAEDESGGRNRLNLRDLFKRK